MSIVLTVFFDDPFWVGLFTLVENNQTRSCRVVFGAEPSDNELYAYILKSFRFLVFIDSRPIENVKKPVGNPKRRQREISREIHGTIGQKKSYEAFKLCVQQNKRKVKQKEKRNTKEERDDYIFRMKQKRNKQKHKGH